MFETLSTSSTVKPAARRLCWALAGALLWLGASPLAAGLITNVLPVNVTPTSFSVLWKGVNASPAIAVYADPDGRTNLTSQLEVEFLPLRTGDTRPAAGYERRQNQMTLQRRAKNRGYMLARVSGCLPATTYYYSVSGLPVGSRVAVYPESGPLPSVTTEKENSFILDDQVLALDVPGFDSYGRIVTLSNANASYCLASVVGDGVANSNFVFFNASDLFLLAGGGNFGAVGAQRFTADVLGLYGWPDTKVDFTVTFGTNLNTAGDTRDSMHTDFVTVTLGSVAVQTGQSTNVTVQLDSSANLSEVSFSVDLPAQTLTNLAWDGLAAEIDPASVLVSPPVTNTTWTLRLATRAGQFITGPRQVGQLVFTAVPGQHSSFLPLAPQPLNAARTDSTLVTNLFSQAGRAVVVGPEALLDASLNPDGSRALTLYGNPPVTYGIECATNLTGSAVWTLLPTTFPLTSVSAPVPQVDQNASVIFYRAVELGHN